MRNKAAQDRACASGRHPFEGQLKWPFEADGEVVRDYHGEFAAACADANTALLLAAAPALFMYYRASAACSDAFISGRPLDARSITRLTDARAACAAALEKFRV